MKRFDKFLIAFLTLTHLIAFLTLTHLSHADNPQCNTPTHCALEKFPRFYMDLEEPDKERAIRVDAIGDSINAVTDNPTERAWLIMQAWHEARLARFVDLDLPRCHEGWNGWCDNGAAWSVWQLQNTDRSGTREDAARAAIETMRQAGNHCAAQGYDYWIGGTALYGTGKSCVRKASEKRVAHMWQIRAQLVAK